MGGSDVPQSRIYKSEAKGVVNVAEKEVVTVT